MKKAQTKTQQSQYPNGNSNSNSNNSDYDPSNDNSFDSSSNTNDNSATNASMHMSRTNTEGSNMSGRKGQNPTISNSNGEDEFNKRSSKSSSSKRSGKLSRQSSRTSNSNGEDEFNKRSSKSSSSKKSGKLSRQSSRTSNSNSNSNSNGEDEFNKRSSKSSSSKKSGKLSRQSSRTSNSNSNSNSNGEDEFNKRSSKSSSSKKSGKSIRSQDSKKTDYSQKSAANNADAHGKISRRIIHEREQRCAKIKEASKVQFKMILNEDGHLDNKFNISRHCVEMSSMLPQKDQLDTDILKVYYPSVYNKDICEHPQVGAHWFSDNIDKPDGLDICILSDKDRKCMSNIDKKACSADTSCTHVPNDNIVFGGLAGRCVNAGHATKIREMTKGRLPQEWPYIYNKDHALNTYLRRYFSTDPSLKLSTDPMNVWAPSLNNTPITNPGPCAARKTEDIDKMRPGMYQGVVHATAMALARQPPAKLLQDSSIEAKKQLPPRGILVWHSTGSGKTATAAGIVDAFRYSIGPNTKKLRKIIYLTSVDALKSNTSAEFAKEARRFFPTYSDWKESWKKAKTTSPAALAAEEARQTALMGDKYKADRSYDTDAHGRMILISFAEFNNRLNINPTGATINKADRAFAKDAVIIIDEVQNLFKPLSAQAQDNAAVRQWLSSDYYSKKNYLADQGDMKVIMMSATPGESIKQTIDFLNVVRNPYTERIRVPQFDDEHSVDAFKSSVRGLVSFLDLSNDKSRFPVIKENVTIQCQMSSFHADKYRTDYMALLNAIKALNAKIRSVGASIESSNSIEKFAYNMAMDEYKDPKGSKDSRILAIATDVNAVRNAYKKVRYMSTWASGGFRENPKAAPKLKSREFWENTSTKVMKFVELSQRPGKHYAYVEKNLTMDGVKSSFNPGIQSVGKALEVMAGWQRLWVDDVLDMGKILGINLVSQRKPTKAGTQTGGDRKRGRNADDEDVSNEGITRQKLNAKGSEITDPSIAKAKLLELMKRKHKLDASKSNFYVYLVQTEFVSQAAKKNGKKVTQVDTMARAIRILYNSPANRNGDIIKVCLASGTYNEGIDLQSVRHIHILEPFLTDAAERQTIGRARRNCSHSQLNSSQWDFNIYKYVSTMPPGFNLKTKTDKKGGTRGKHAESNVKTDQDDLRMYPKGNESIDQIVERARITAASSQNLFYHILKANAVDCVLFSKFHELKCFSDSPPPLLTQSSSIVRYKVDEPIIFDKIEDKTENLNNSKNKIANHLPSTDIIDTQKVKNMMHKVKLTSNALSAFDKSSQNGIRTAEQIITRYRQKLSSMMMN